MQARVEGQTVEVSGELIRKYNRPGPRYTSYPTAPNWSESFGPADFYQTLADSNKGRRPLSLYCHIPFCEERCTFCACSVVATPKKEIARSYLKALTREITVVSETLDKNRPVVQIHWGGGTPTYLSPGQIESLFGTLARQFSIAPDAEISIEVDPRVTTDEQLIVLREIGFNRVSLGLQDFDPEVQQEAGRLQSETETRHTILTCRNLGFSGVNMDLVYGLPRQTPERFRVTLQKVLALDPDRIALFNFAYVPWMHPHQKKMSQAHLPDAETKMRMFCEAIGTFEENGYVFIGLDHFAKQNDELVAARQDGTMYRNFQGYTTRRGCDLLGMGVTAISSVADTFAQNVKKLKTYEEGVLQNGLVTERGYCLNDDDRLRRELIRELFCHQKVSLDWISFPGERQAMETFARDGLVAIGEGTLGVTPLGRLFLRNIAMVFDAHLQKETARFSRTV